MKGYSPYIVVLSVMFGFSSPLLAARISDIANTAHNLSLSGPGPVTATSESQICVFCHTPHNAENVPAAPLWNRTLEATTYVPYDSASMDTMDIAPPAPGEASKLCLSCHDGTLALGAVNVLNGQSNVTIDLTSTATVPAGSMPEGSGADTGFTRRLGTDLTNDHPISFTYDSVLANADGELRDPALVSHIGNRSPGNNPPVPLENSKMQCTSCHDPHIRDSDAAKNIKFLRLNRFQAATPLGGNFDQTNDIVCLACHDKLGQAWAVSAHADSSVADEIYTDAAATQRDFALGTQVWEAACLNCHDTHTVQGSRRLLREGTDSSASPKTGGNPAIEETCYQCHSADGGVLQNQGSINFPVPDIKTDFDSEQTSPGNRHMPIVSTHQPAGVERHEITDANFSESQLRLGKGNLNNRHVECTDCHNPHRVMKNQLFNGTAGNTVGTHEHEATIQHSNIASGVLRGSWGVEPLYGSSAWGSVPSQYIVKQGDGGTGASTGVNSSHLTREYQVCLKCHSDYAYDSAPYLVNSGGGTPSATNQVTQFTNQAMEFQAPSSDTGEPGGNHRGWHPVLAPTGRTLAERNAEDPAGLRNSTLFLDPWNGGGVTSPFVGNQTMYCSDCHGSATANGTAVPDGGANGKPWGPHGSSKDFILKGDWNNGTGTNQEDDVCFKCHNYNDYANPNNDDPNYSGFRASGGGGMGMCGLSFRSRNLHIGHARRIGRMECTWCHAAVPHGWKNKALLVDISQEGGNEPYTNGPYYLEAMLGGGGPVNWKSSGNWTADDCGGVMWMGMGGMGGMGGGGGGCSNPP